MPLPKAPSKPATLLDPATLANTRLKPGTTNSRKQPEKAGAPVQPVARAELASAPVASTGTAFKPETTSREDTSPRAAASTNRNGKGQATDTKSATSANRSQSTRPVTVAQEQGKTRVSGKSQSRTPENRAPKSRAQKDRAKESLAPRTAGKKRSAPSAAQNERPRLFVLDTNVLMHDPSSLYRFAEHDVYLPMMTLEELDNHKRGMSEVSRNARQVSRTLDAMLASTEKSIDEGIALSVLGNREASGRLYFQTQAIETMLPSTLPVGKADNQILGVVRELHERFPERDVVLVSKDINMRIKARTLGLPAEDYRNDQVLEDTDLLYGGTLRLPDNFWETHGKGIESWQSGGNTFYRIKGPLVSSMMINQFVYSEGESPLLAQVRELTGQTAVLQTLRDFGHHKNAVWGITARNREQNFALNLLMNPEVDFVTLLGQAGTGKTLLTLAAALTQVIESRRYSEIIMTRATVPVGEDIGYLPGTEEEKMQPWMGALEDNLEVLNQGDSAGGEWGRSSTNDLIRSRVKVKAMSFMRGRTFINKFLIVDEAQNLTPKQMKTLITRAGPGTKVICMGNISQIDTPYLTEGSSGLTYVVDRFKGWAHSGTVTLQRGERSRLADFAADAL